MLDVFVASLEMDLNDYVNLYQMFFFIPIVASFFAASLVDRFGLKLVLYVTLLMAVLRNIARMLLFAPHLPGWRSLRLLYWMLQRGLTQMNNAFYNCFPLSMAESWFSESERSIALTMLLSAPSLGGAGASLILPRLVHSIATWPWLVWFNFCALLVSLLSISLGVRHSLPPEGPPSLRSKVKLDLKREEAASLAAVPKRALATRAKLLLQELTRIFKSGNLMIQMVAKITIDQLFSTILLVLQDIFDGEGLSHVFTGKFMALIDITAIAFQLLVAKRMKPKKEFQDPYNTRICKRLLVAEMFMFILFALSLVVHELEFLGLATEAQMKWLERNQWLVVCGTAVGFALVRNCAQPYLNEQTAVLICGLTSEANSGAADTAVGEILFNLYAFIFVHLRHLETLVAGPLVSTTTNIIEPEDGASGDVHEVAAGRPLYLRPVLFVCLVAVCTTMNYVIRFDAASSKRRERIRRLTRTSSCVPGDLYDFKRDSRVVEMVEFEMTRL